jgi:hypothetical protein
MSVAPSALEYLEGALSAALEGARGHDGSLGYFLWEQLEDRPALSDSPLLAEEIKSNEPNHSYNPAFPQATRERRASGATGYARDRCDPCRPVFVLGRESEKGMEVMGTG